MSSSAHAVNSPRLETEAFAGSDQDWGRLLPLPPDLELGASFMHIDRLVLLPVVLEAQCLVCANEQKLPQLALGHRIDELVTPWLVDTPNLLCVLGEHHPRGRLAHETTMLRGATIASTMPVSAATTTSGRITARSTTAPASIRAPGPR